MAGLDNDNIDNLSDTIDHQTSGVDNSSAEDNRTPETVYIRDVNIRLKADKELFCDVTGLAILSGPQISDKGVLADNSNSKIKVFDLMNGTLVDDLSIAYKPKQLVKVNETKVAVAIDNYGIILVRVDRDIAIERLLIRGDYVFEGISSCDDDVYICKGEESITKVDTFGKEVREITSQRVSTNRYDPNVYQECYESKQEQFFSSVVYGQSGHKQMCMIVSDVTYFRDGRYRSFQETKCPGQKYLAYGKRKEGVKDRIKLDGQPKFITVSDDGKLVFVVADHTCDVIYVVRTGEKHARVLLRKDDGVFNASCVAYCSSTGRLAVTMRDNNFMKVFQLHRMV